MINNLKKSNFIKKEITWLAVFAIIAIPLYTFLFATKESPFSYTFSMIGNKLGYRLNFIIWGTVTGLLLTFFVIRLYVLKSFKHERAGRLVIWSLVFLILTVLIPAFDRLPILLKLHALSAVAFGLTITASLYLFIKHLEHTHQKLYSWSMLMMCIIIGGSLLMLLIFGMTGIFELFFFLSLSLFLAILNRRLFHDNNKPLPE